MKKELDLSGLRLVFGGLILQLLSVLFVGRLASGLMNGRTASGIIACAVSAAALILILTGLSRLGEASPFFTKARRSYLIQLFIQIILAVILVVLGRSGWTIDSISVTPRSTILELLLLGVVLLAVWILSMLFSVRTTLRGCGHVAEQTNDPLFSIKCIKSWRLWYLSFLLTILMVLASVAIIITVLRKTIENGTAGQDLTQAIFTNVTSSVLLVSIIVMIVLIFFLIAHILFLARVRTTYREYHMEEVVPSEPGSQAPAFADYVKKELEGIGYTPAQVSAMESYSEEAAFEEADESYEEEMEEEAVRELASGQRYRKIVPGEEEEIPEESSDMLEIAKLFKKNRK